MIIDLQKFVSSERPIWSELEGVLHRIEMQPNRTLPLDELQRFHYLYERTAADLGRINTFASEPETRRYLEHLVARAYGEIHETRESRHRFSPGKWFLRTVPQTFRRHIRAFWLSVGITIAGCLFGGGAIAFDPESKETLMPFSHLMMDPAERVAMEEKAEKDRMSGSKASFSTHLMTHNTKVAINTMALGMTWGIGTVIVLFFNGIILGAVALDYILAGGLAVRDLNRRLKLAVPESEAYTTVGGFLMTEAGHLLKPGEVVTHDGLVFHIDRVEKRRVMRVELEIQKTHSNDEPSSVAKTGSG